MMVKSCDESEWNCEVRIWNIFVYGYVMVCITLWCNDMCMNKNGKVPM